MNAGREDEIKREVNMLHSPVPENSPRQCPPSGSTTTAKAAKPLAETAPESTAVASEDEEPLNEPDPGKGPEFNHATQLIIVKKEMDENAGQEDKIQDEVYQNECSNSSSESPKFSPPLVSGSTAKPLEGIENEGYVDSDSNTSRRLTCPKKCTRCVVRGEKRLPDDRNEWPIDKIELGCLEECCELLTPITSSKVPLLSTLTCFNHKEALEQKYKSTEEIELTEFILARWATCRGHDVGAFKKIAKDMLRVDIIHALEKWEKMSVCHGCGVKCY